MTRALLEQALDDPDIYLLIDPSGKVRGADTTLKGITRVLIGGEMSTNMWNAIFMSETPEKAECIYAEHGWKIIRSELAKPDAQQERKPVSEDQIKEAFGKLYPNDLPLLEIAENNRDFAIEAIGARHHYRAFKLGVRAVEAFHGIKETP